MNYNGEKYIKKWVDPHCGYNPSNCPYGDYCADCRPPKEPEKPSDPPSGPPEANPARGKG